MSEHHQPQVFPVKPAAAARTLTDAAHFLKLTEQAARQPNDFWREECKRISWIKPPTIIKNTRFDAGVSIKWFEDGTLNASASCLDKHLATRGDDVAIIWEGDNPDVSEKITFRQLHERVC